jgi:exodeoxyribonuclease V beta subunit
MKRFNVLDRKQDVHRHYLLEASAGTGKTFSIENIVVRLLLEEPALPLEKILVVTFTRAATRDLKTRIRLNIEKALSFLSGSKADIPDYLLACLEQGEKSISLAKKKLEQALFCFDQAQIFTIHGFCARMLRDHLFESDIGISFGASENSFLDSQVIGIIRDYFRTEVKNTHFSKEQLNILLREYGPSVEDLEKTLLKLIKKSLEIENSPDFSFYLKAFQAQMLELKLNWKFSSDKIIADFVKQAPFYKDLCDRQSNLKAENLDIIARFASLFDLNAWGSEEMDQILRDGLFYVEALDPSQRKAKAKLPSDLNYPNFIDLIQEKIQPIIKQAGSPLIILSRVAHGCQKMLKKFLLEEEKLGFDDLLLAMQQATQNPQFVTCIREVYRTAIIDEFQDTDPLQWNIFNNLFLKAGKEWGHLYLVGDPKQSIYAFRQADIYTYLSAAEALGPEHHASLDTNYRSQPSLVEALNTLFSSVNTPGFISLPRIGKTLGCNPVFSYPKNKEKNFSDKLGSIHFCLSSSLNKEAGKQLQFEEVEHNYFFPYFAEEISRLSRLDGFRYDQFAILVNDRFQAKRLHKFLMVNNIPAILQRTSSLADSSALPALLEFLQAVLNPKNESYIKTALGGRIIGWKHTEVQELKEHANLEKVLAKFYSFRKQWFTNGFAAFFQQLLQSQWHASSQTVAEKILEQGLEEFYTDLNQLAHLLMEEESRTFAVPEKLLKFLDQIPLLDLNEDIRLKKHADLTQDAVNILTLHSSKGLEFDIVFALGLINRSPAPSALLPKNDPPRLSAEPDTQSAEYKKYCHEFDAEKMRQLYVAMTRAKYRLYAPVIVTESDKVPAAGCASPMELFLARFGQQEISQDHLYERLSGFDGQKLMNFIDKISPQKSLSYSYLKDKIVAHPVQKIDSTDIKLVPPPTFKIPGQKKHMLSFTSLANSNPIGLSETPHDFNAALKNTHTLPSGAETGNLLHKILESISFKIVKEKSNAEQIEDLVHPYIHKSNFADWKSVISQIIFEALQTPLSIDGTSLRLCDLSSDQRYHETEFLYPSNALLHIEELERLPGYIKGVIDLVFMHRGKYYLLDWKSNWLGSTFESYSQVHLQQAMADHDYLLQANIYAEALKRYLQLIDKRPFEEIFGGVFYMFLRGLNTKSQEDYGIYRIAP